MPISLFGGFAPTAGTAAALRADLANAADITKNSALVGWLRAALSAVAATVQNRINWLPYNAFEFMTVAQIASVQAYSFLYDNTPQLQAALNAANLAGRILEVAAGGYKLVGTILIPNPSGYGTCRIIGAGISNPFAIGGAFGTQFRQFGAFTSLKFDGAGSGQSANLELEVSGIGFYATDITHASPVVYIRGFYGVCRFHHNVIWQAGVGNGLQIDYATTSSVDNNYFLNRDCITPVLGTARVGIGFYLSQSYGSGLLSLYKNTARGFRTGYYIGNDGTSGTVYNFSMRDCECSTVYDGIYLANTTYKAVIENIYGEGGDGGTFITDNGFQNTIEDCYSFPGWLTHLLSTATSFGGNYSKNQFSLSAASPATPNAIGIDLRGNSGYGRTCNGNTLTFGGAGGAIAGVVGIKVAGVNPQLAMNGNVFNPPTWIGGAGTKAISDISTTSAGAGSGIQGMAQVIDTAGNAYPYVGFGAYGVGVGAALSQANVAANVLTISVASDFVITATVATTVNSVTAPNFEGKLFWIRTTNANTTFANTASLKMAGGINYTPGANGASILFKCQSGICWEQSRTAY